MERDIISDYEQTWDSFAVQMKNKKLVIFGTGIAGSVFFMRYPDISIALVIDNSKKKQGHYLRDFLFGYANQDSGNQEMGERNAGQSRSHSFRSQEKGRER